MKKLIKLIKKWTTPKVSINHYVKENHTHQQIKPYVFYANIYI